MGEGPITFTAIAEYAKMFNIEEFADFLYLIRRIDNEFIRKNNAKKDTTTDNKDKGRKHQ